MKKEALFYERNNMGMIHCKLCPHSCKIQENKKGLCNVREVQNDMLYTLNYGEITSLSLDPIEKKPLFHFKPGSSILSAGSFGCNFHCGFCQNHSIAKAIPPSRHFEPEDLISLAEDSKKDKNIGIAFTYNEPSIWYEYVYDTCKKAKNLDLDLILVSNGYLSEEPLNELLPYVAAANIDLKAFSNKFYKEVCIGDLENVLSTIQIANSKCHVEITTLLVNGYNDSDEEVRNLSKWISEVSPDIPLHLSRYHPTYKFDAATTPATPVDRILSCRDIAKEYLHYVYVGNVTGIDNNTYCPKCNELVIKRSDFRGKSLISDCSCPKCGYQINVVL